MEVLYHPRSWKTGACVWKGEPLFIWDTGMAIIIIYAGCSHSVRRRERCFCGDGCQRFSLFIISIMIVIKIVIKSNQLILFCGQVAMIFVKQKKAWASLVPRLATSFNSSARSSYRYNASVSNCIDQTSCNSSAGRFFFISMNLIIMFAANDKHQDDNDQKTRRVSAASGKVLPLRSSHHVHPYQVQSTSLSFFALIISTSMFYPRFTRC